MSRIGVISDIHGNLSALDAVLRAFDESSVDRILCCGDLVGYGPSPEQVVDRCMERGIICVRGNHEDAICHLNRYQVAGREADLRFLQSTRSLLRPEQCGLLEELPVTHIEKDLVVIHGSLRAPMWEYILDARAAAESFLLLGRPMAFFGHSHIQGGFVQRRGVVSALPESVERLEFDPKARYLINPGSVGFPRDGDPRAAFALLDLASGAIEFRRVPFRIDLQSRRG